MKLLYKCNTWNSNNFPFPGPFIISASIIFVYICLTIILVPFAMNFDIFLIPIIKQPFLSLSLCEGSPGGFKSFRIYSGTSIVLSSESSSLSLLKYTVDSPGNAFNNLLLSSCTFLFNGVRMALTAKTSFEHFETSLP